MKLQRIFAVILRHFRLLKRDMNRSIMMLFWPVLDIIAWGFMGAWIQQQTTEHMQLALLSVILLVQVTNRGAKDMGYLLLEEIFSDNLQNFFGSPLRTSEWLFGGICFSVILQVIIALYCTLIVFFIFPKILFNILFNYLIFLIPLIISGIFLGLISLNIILLFGKKGSEFAFVIPWVYTPFCSVFFPRSILPVWAQKIGSILPMTYIFEGIRNYILYNINPINDIWISIYLGLFYITILLFLFYYTFKYCKKRGLKRLLD